MPQRTFLRCYHGVGVAVGVAGVGSAGMVTGWMKVLQTPGHEPSGFEHVVGQVILKVGVELGVGVGDPLVVGYGLGVGTPWTIGACGIVTSVGSPVGTGDGATSGVTSGAGCGNWIGSSW